MSYNGSGTFVINSTGQPVVTGTVISSSTFNSLTADLGTGLSTAITKDGQTTTTAKIPFALGISAAVASNFAAGTVAAPSIYLSTDTGTGFYRIGANNNGYSVSGTKLLDFSSALFAVTGAATISTTLGVTGATTLSSTLGVTGTSTLAAVNASGAIAVSNAANSNQLVLTSSGNNAGLKLVNTLSAGTSWSFDSNTGGTLEILETGIATWLRIAKTTGAVTIPGTLGVTGVVTGNATNSFVAAPAAGVGNPVYHTLTNNGGTLYIGMDNSTGGAFSAVAGNYGTFIYRPAATQFSITRGTTVDLNISTAGAVTIPGTLGVTGIQTNSALVDANNFRATGVSVAAAGTGAEMHYTSGSAYFIGFNRTGGVYVPVSVGGTTVDLSISGISKLAISAAGVVTVAQNLEVGSGGNLVVGGASTYGQFIYAANASAHTHVYFSNSNGNVGTISTSGSATAYNTSSDYRLKENVQPMKNALATVAALKPVLFNWKVDGSTSQGFIAHELAKVVPDCVTGEKDATEMQQYEISPAIPATQDEEGNEVTTAVEAVMGEREVPRYQGIDTSFLVATLTAAIQELSAKVAALEAR